MKAIHGTMQRLEELLQEYCIDYEVVGSGVMINNLSDVMLLVTEDGIEIVGFNYCGVWTYSPEYVVRKLHKEFGARLQISKAKPIDKTIHCTPEGLIRMMNPKYLESFKELCKYVKQRVPEQ